MRYVNAAQAARMLGIGDKTIRRWLKEGKKLPSAIVKATGEYAIPVHEIEELKALRNEFTPLQEEMTSHDQIDVSALAQRLATLEQEVAELKKGPVPAREHVTAQPLKIQSTDTMPQKEVAQNRPTIEKKAYHRKKETGLPEGALPATEFGLAHGVKRETFRDHMNNGLGPGLIHGPYVPEDGSVLIKDWVHYEERNKRVRKDGTIEKARYLTRQQQQAALDFWKRHDVAFTECHDTRCWCHTVKQRELT